MKLSDKRLDKYRGGKTPPSCPKLPGYYCMDKPKQCKTRIVKGVLFSCERSLSKQVITRLHKRNVPNDELRDIVTFGQLGRPKKKNGRGPSMAKLPLAKREEVEKLFKDEVPKEPKPQPKPPPPTHCRMCEKGLTRLPWNTRCDLLICENPDCSLYHTPQGRILNERFEQSDTISELMSME